MPADRTNLDFNFIDLVLSVSGRVRPDDLQSIPAERRAELLMAYQSARTTQEPLYFDGDTLVRGAVRPGASAPAPDASQAAPAPAPFDAPNVVAPLAAAAAASAAPAPLDIPEVTAPPATPAPFSIPEVVASAAAPETAPAAPVPFTVPEVVPSPEGPAGEQPLLYGPAAYTQPYAAPESAYAPAGESSESPPPVPPPLDAGTSGYPAANDSFAIPSAESLESSMFFGQEGAEPEFTEFPELAAGSKVSLAYWLLPVLLTWVGGLIAFFMLRRKEPKTARTMLIWGVALTVVYALLAGVAVLGYGLLTFNSANSTSSTQVSSVQPTVAADYPKWTVAKDYGAVLSHISDPANPTVKLREDHAYELVSPDKAMHMTAWYARSGTTTDALRATIWVNPDTLFKSTEGTGTLGRSLIKTMAQDHPAEEVLGAYVVGKPEGATTTYNVGWALTKVGEITRSEHVYTFAQASGWTQLAATSKSTSTWNSALAVK
jgi:hypothetical protein